MVHFEAILNVQAEEGDLPKTCTWVPTAVVGKRKGRQAGPTSRLNTMSCDTRTTPMSFFCVTELYSGCGSKCSVVSNLAEFVSVPVMSIIALINFSFFNFLGWCETVSTQYVSH